MRRHNIFFFCLATFNKFIEINVNVGELDENIHDLILKINIIKKKTKLPSINFFVNSLEKPTLEGFIYFYHAHLKENNEMNSKDRLLKKPIGIQNRIKRIKKYRASVHICSYLHVVVIFPLAGYLIPRYWFSLYVFRGTLSD